MTDLDHLLDQAQAVVDSVTHDDMGSMVAGRWVGGSGGLLSPETLRHVDQLRRQLLAFRPGKGGRKVTVIDGDTLYSIAARELGDGDGWPRLYMVNLRAIHAEIARRGLRPSPDWIFPGTQLIIP